MQEQPSRTKAWPSPQNSGIIAPFNQAMVAMMLDMQSKDDGFPTRLRDLRKAKNLSQSDLGLRAGLHYTHIGRFERGTSRPGGDTLKRLADALDTTSDYLIEGAATDLAQARVTDSDLLRQFQAVEHLPDADKHIVKTLLDAFLTRRQIESMVR
jgi:transcriptional regulator with XRE-family HTH domain